MKFKIKFIYDARELGYIDRSTNRLKFIIRAKISIETYFIIESAWIV
jgi:hypothetical protein